MAPLTNHVVVNVSAQSLGAAKPGYGVPLYLSAYAAWAVERTREYSSYDAVLVDFTDARSPEALFAASVFGQDPKPTKVRIGRSALKPTMVYIITPTAVNSYTYLLNVAGKGVTSTSLTFTSDSSATLTEVCAGLVTALNGVTGKNYTATTDNTIVTITATAAGDWFSIEVPTTCRPNMAIAQTHADPGVATDLAAIDAEQSDWYFLVTGYNSTAYVAAVAAWIQTKKKIYIADVCATSTVSAVVASAGTYDTADALKTGAYTRTSGQFHTCPAEMFGAALVGTCAPIDPGGETWKFKTPAGIPAVTLTDTERANLTNKKANTIESVASVNVTVEGTVASGQFIDVIRGLDWLESEVAIGVFNVQVGAKKVPRTAAGVNMLAAPIRAAGRKAVENGVLTDDPAPAVTVPSAKDPTKWDATTRALSGFVLTGTLASAVHKTTVAINVTA